MERVYGVARVGEEVVAGAGDDDGMSWVGADAVVFARVCGLMPGTVAIKFELDEAWEARFLSNDIKEEATIFRSLNSLQVRVSSIQGFLGTTKNCVLPSYQS